MLSRVPPGDLRPTKHHVRDVECPAAVIPIETEQSRRHPVCGATVVEYADRAQVLETQRARSCDELPILRAQYVARGVRVLFGSRWRLNRFQERTIVLRTGAKPILVVYTGDKIAAPFDPNTPGEACPEDTYVLALNTKCELIGSSHNTRVKSYAATGIELSSAAISAGSPAFRLRTQFTTAADASIWCLIFRETLAHATWSRDVRPVEQRQQTLRRYIRVVQHIQHSESFVVKVLSTNNEHGDSHELQILRRLYSSWAAQDVNLVRGYRVVETTEETLLIMPHVPGTTLLQFLRQRRRQNDRKLRDEEVWCLVAHLATLLQAVHQSGIIHCDLNLENVLVSKDLSRAWLIDFGGAVNLLDSRQSHQMTGTPGYVAPERVQDPLVPPTPKTDVFSLGIVLFQALTGQHPYTDATREKRPLQLVDSLCLDCARAGEIMTKYSVSLELRNLVGEMLTADPQARISLDNVLTVSRHASKRG